VKLPVKVFWTVSLLVLCAAGIIAVGASVVVRRSLSQVEEEQSDTLAAQFRQDYLRRGEEVVVRVRGIAESESTLRMAIDLMSANADPSLYLNDAHVVAVSQHLDFLDFVDSEGKIISSAEWPVHANSSMPWVLQAKDWSSRGSFLTRVDSEAGPDLAVLAISNAVPVADKKVYVVGGVRLGSDFLRSVILPPGSRAMIYRNIDPNFSASNLIDSGGSVTDGEHFAPLIADELRTPVQRAVQVDSGIDGSKSHYVQLVPLQGRDGRLLGIFLVEQPEARMVAANRFIFFLGLEALLVAFLFGWLAKSWANTRLAVPVELLTESSHDIAAGNFGTKVDAPVLTGGRGRTAKDDEIARLIREFNEMSSKLREKLDVAAQGERVSAWRELAGTFASEVTPSLKQFDGTVSDLRGWGAEGNESYHHGITDFAAVLSTQVERLRSVVDAFADFARMPMPRLIAVDLNGLVQRVMRANESKFAAVGRPPVLPEVRLQPELALIHGDPVLLEKAIDNLICSVIEAMPAGGPLVIKTRNVAQGVRLDVSNHGAGISSEEWRRFSPKAASSMCASNGYYDPLSLAIVQAVVSDHHGSLLIEDEAGVGTRYRIELPEDSPVADRKPLPDKSVTEKLAEIHEEEAANEVASKGKIGTAVSGGGGSSAASTSGPTGNSSNSSSNSSSNGSVSNLASGNGQPASGAASGNGSGPAAKPETEKPGGDKPPTDSSTRLPNFLP